MNSNPFNRFVIMLHRLESRPFTKEIIQKHIEHLARLDRQGLLEMCGPFTDYPAGMVIIKTTNKEAAIVIAESDPFVREGFSTYEVRTWLLACRENNYLSM